MNTEVVYASQMEDLVERIALLRNPDLKKQRAKERAALRSYERARRDRPEMTASDGFMGITLPGTEQRGFTKTVAGQEVFIKRPQLSRANAYVYGHAFSLTGPSRRKQYGILPNGHLNREIRHQRVDEYAAVMSAGEWRDLYSDPISITDEGHVLNGQHRIAAATQVDWGRKRGPAFLVVWGADPKEAMFADGSRRTDRDQKTILGKVARATAD